MAQSKKKVAKAIYRFAVDGTASGDVVLVETAPIPAGAIVTGIVTRETTALTGSTDIDIQVGAEAATQKLTVACDFTGADSGLVANPGTEAVPFAVTTGGNITLHNDGSAITAGVVEIYVEYLY
jgi:hypothetical protein